MSVESAAAASPSDSLCPAYLTGSTPSTVAFPWPWAPPGEGADFQDLLGLDAERSISILAGHGRPQPSQPGADQT
jgi:hypothetical protein